MKFSRISLLIILLSSFLICGYKSNRKYTFFPPDLIISPDSSKLLFSCRWTEGQDVFILDLNTNKLRQLTNSKRGEKYKVIGWLPDGEKIAFSYRSLSKFKKPWRDEYKKFFGLGTMKPDGSEKSFFCYGKLPYFCKLSPDGSKVGGIFMPFQKKGIHYEIDLINVETGKEKCLLEDNLINLLPEGIVWISNDKILFGREDGLCTIDVEKGEVKTFIDEEDIGLFSLSPSREELLFTKADESIWKVTIADMAKKRVFSGKKSISVGSVPVWSPDAKRFAFIFESKHPKNKEPQISLMSQNGELEKEISLNKSYFRVLVLLPEEKGIICIEPPLTFWKINFDDTNQRQIIPKLRE